MCHKRLFDSTPLWVKLLPVLPERLTPVSSAVCEYVNPGRLHHGQTGNQAIALTTWTVSDSGQITGYPEDILPTSSTFGAAHCRSRASAP